MHKRQASQEVRMFHQVSTKKREKMVRNEQKKVKRERHEREKEYMKALQELGSAVGEYHGSGQGESDSVGHIVLGDDLGLAEDLSEEQNEESTDYAHPLMFLYDCETTGLSIYSDNIIEIAAEVFDCPVPHTNTTYSSLVKTSRRIPLLKIRIIIS